MSSAGRFFAALAFGSAFVGAGTASTAAHPIDRIFVIVMENHNFDEIIGRTDSSGLRYETPFITQLAAQNGLALDAFGVTQPSLGNYISLLSGDSFGIHDDNGSCYTKPKPPRNCHAFNSQNLVDLLEAKGMTWGAYMESAPTIGFLGEQWPRKGDGLYRQKHNPFPYFTDIATNPQRMKRVKPLGYLPNELIATAPNFVFITPNECHDMHGAIPLCPGPFDKLIVDGDKEIEYLITLITSSNAFTPNSLIFVTWDEGDRSNQGCCDSPAIGGGHIPMIVVSGTTGPQLRSAVPYNQYSILATVESVWGLPQLGYTKDTAHVKPMLDLIR
jgi:hypothetical protein